MSNLNHLSLKKKKELSSQLGRLEKQFITGIKFTDDIHKNIFSVSNSNPYPFIYWAVIYCLIWLYSNQMRYFLSVRFFLFFSIWFFFVVLIVLSMWRSEMGIIERLGNWCLSLYDFWEVFDFKCLDCKYVTGGR